MEAMETLPRKTQIGKNDARAWRSSQFQFRSLLQVCSVYNCNNYSMVCVLAIEDPIMSTTESIAFTESVMK